MTDAVVSAVEFFTGVTSKRVGTFADAVRGERAAVETVFGLSTVGPLVERTARADVSLQVVSAMYAKSLLKV